MLGSRSQSALKESLSELDLNAKEELDGADLGDDTDLELDLDPAESDIDIGIEKPEQIEQKANDGYQIKNVSDQLDGMVEKWFELAQDMDQSKKEAFLRLGDRLSELSDVLKMEFMDA